MDYEERQAKQARIRTLCNAAVALVRERGKATGNVLADGRLKRLIEYDTFLLKILFAYPHTDDDPTDPRANYLEVRHRGEPVLKLHWNGDRLRTSLYVPGSWEQHLS